MLKVNEDEGRKTPKVKDVVNSIVSPRRKLLELEEQFEAVSSPRNFNRTYGLTSRE